MVWLLILLVLAFVLIKPLRIAVLGPGLLVGFVVFGGAFGMIGGAMLLGLFGGPAILSLGFGLLGATSLGLFGAARLQKKNQRRNKSDQLSRRH